MNNFNRASVNLFKHDVNSDIIKNILRNERVQSRNRSRSRSSSSSSSSRSRIVR